jgi:dipeptidase E
MNDTVQVLSSFGATVTTVELETCDQASDMIKGHHIIWFGGGMPGYLLYWIRRRELDKILPTLLEQGMVYVGSSAGSMIASASQSVGEWYIGETEPGASLIPGLGLVDFEIYPHYENSLYAKIKKKFIGNKLFLLKNGEAIIVENKNIRVFGEEKIIENKKTNI